MGGGQGLLLVTVGWEASPLALDGTLVTSNLCSDFSADREGWSDVWGWDRLPWRYEPWVLLKRVSLVKHYFPLLLVPMTVILMGLYHGGYLCGLSFLRGSQVPEKHVYVAPRESSLKLQSLITLIWIWKLLWVVWVSSFQKAEEIQYYSMPFVSFRLPFKNTDTLCHNLCDWCWNKLQDPSPLLVH